MSAWLAAMMAGMLLAQAPAASAPPPEDDQTTVEGVVITARPEAPPVDVLKDFVAEVSAKSANNRYARWDRKVCIGVIGARREFAQRMIDRVAANVVAVGLEVDEPGCRANMIVFLTGESQGFTKSLVDGNPLPFERYDYGRTRGRKALEDFIRTPRAVRWWHVTRTVTADGQKYEREGSVRVRDVSRIKATTRDDFNHVIIVVDVKKTGVMNFDALADYIAMVGLAQIEPEADTSKVNSILNLFADRDAGRPPVTHLSEWDRAYLQGLYNAQREVVRSTRQQGDIARGMAKELGGDAKPKKAGDKDE